MVAFCPYVTGPVLVKVNFRDGEGFVNLGYSTDGVQPELIHYTNPIHSDQYGGTSGPEVERQFMGMSARISLSLPVFSATLVKYLRNAQRSENWSSNANGQLVDIGGLLTCANRSIQILLVGQADAAATVADANAITLATALNFPNCWFDGPVRLNYGSKNTMVDIDLKATPFTTDTGQSGDGKTYLWLENTHLVTNMATYAGSTQSA